MAEHDPRYVPDKIYARHLSNMDHFGRINDHAIDSFGMKKFEPVKGGVVYVLSDGSPITGDVSAIKIGVTTKLLKRMKTLQTGCSKKIWCLMVIFNLDGIHANDIESQLHSSLSDHQLVGEWFKYSRTVFDLIYAGIESNRCDFWTVYEWMGAEADRHHIMSNGYMAAMDAVGKCEMWGNGPVRRY